MKRLPVLLILLVVIACSEKRAPNKFSDPTLIKIADLQDRRSTDSLLTFLKSENPVYRREAALAFASVQDSAASELLGNLLLLDKDSAVRRNAAFALGQTGGYQAVNALVPAIQHNDRAVIREVLEALGKTAEDVDVKYLINYQTKDSILMEGQAWGFYRLSVRKKADSIVTRKATAFLLPENSYQTRLGAATYFGRSPKIEGRNFEDELVNAALHDTIADIRMLAMLGLKHIDVTKALPALLAGLSDTDYRVRSNAVRVSQSFPLKDVQQVALTGLNDSIEMVQVTASESIRNNKEHYPIEKLLDAVTAANCPRVKANLYGAILAVHTSSETIREIIGLYGSASVYDKSWLLSALSEAKSPYEKDAIKFISGELLKESNPLVIQSTAASALVSMNKRAGNTVSDREYLSIYLQAIGNGDVAVTGVISSALTDTTLHYKGEIKDLKFLYDAKARLSLPKDIESLEPLEKAIAYLEGKPEPAKLKNEFNHPIDWEFVKTIPADQLVEIKTSKGTIVLRLLVSEAPGSAANFVQLVNKKYFDGKFFHRVVPNFVIQTGCNRGDGFGSEDYSIRSEFSLRRYVTGSVGMASAGKDTEGTQWFITHSPTPHLDGRYTIFAETVSGMDVVHHIEVGDTILEVTLKNDKR